MSKSRCLVSLSRAAMVASGLLLTVPVTGWAQIEEIVVTTRKKVESLQEVPIAVDAISAQQLDRRGITNAADIAKMSTSVQFDQSFGPADVRIAVRGLSNTRGRSNVAFLVDGVDVTTENFVSAGSGLLANQRLLVDVERVEIVKGPQSALFGRAAFAGAISYTTKEPGEELESVLRVEAADYGKYQVDGAIGGPVAGLEDVLGLRVSGAYWTGGGFYTNSVSGEPLGDEEGYGIAATGVWTPTEQVKIKLRSEYSDSKVGPRAAVRVGGGHHVRPHAGVGAQPGGQPSDPSDLQQTLLEYPEGALQINPDTGRPALGVAGPSSFTGLLNFDQYCPPELQDDTKGPGFCLPQNYGSTGNFAPPAISEDSNTGQDYTGTDTQLFRTTLNASIDYDFGTFSSITGFTDYQAFDDYDQDYQAVGRPDTLLTHNQARSDLSTEQFSQELRFTSDFDGAFNFSVGGFYWEEDRRLEDLNYIINCIDYQRLPTPVPEGRVWPDPAAQAAGTCDGTLGSVSSWQEFANRIFPCEYDSAGNPVEDPLTGKCKQTARTPAPWRAETEHWSAYVNLEWELSDTWTVGFEDRYIDEDFYSLRPNKSSCSIIAAAAVGTQLAEEKRLGEPGWEDIVCPSEQQMNPNLPFKNDSTGNWFLIEGTEKSSYHTPKVYTNWQPTDDAMIYFSWARGQKPGGINQLAAGGSPTTIDFERFEPEKVDAWELGAKTSWEAAGFLQFNTALFLNDYTDKQIGTQIIKDNPDGSTRLQPRIVNAAAAEVWGLELELVWQPSFADGLIMSGSYTYLDPTFVDFIDDTRSLIRSAMHGSCDLVYVDNETEKDVPPGTGGTAKCRLDLSGNNLERVPENAFIGNLQYTHQFMDSSFDYFLEATATYEDERFLGADNFISFDDYWLVDARGGLSGEKWELLLYVRNLFDDDTIKTGGTGPDFGQQVGEIGFTAGLGVSHSFGLLPQPRIFGAKVTMRF